MVINFNHTIVWARDSQASATFLADVLSLPAPKRWGPFLVVTTDNQTNLDFMNADGEIAPQHYAFLVSETEFDEIWCSGTIASLLGRSRPNAAGRDQPARRWARFLF
jgi:hypothetical protein